MVLKLLSSALLVIGCLLAAVAKASVDVLTELEKSGDTWTLTYTTKTPAQQLAFKRNPDHSRADRWTPVSSDYQITNEDGVDLVRRLDGKPFSEVVFVLTPGYIALPKDYAPFAPFSDGGILIHSGRFFACAEHCRDSHNKWSMALAAPEIDTIILDGAATWGSVEWLDSDAGRPDLCALVR